MFCRDSIVQIEHCKGFISWLRLKELVLSRPREAFRQGEIVLRFASRQVRPRILAVMGTALRRLADHQGAEALLARARQLAEQDGDTWGTADTALRLISVFVSTGDCGRALVTAREASGMFAGIGSFGDVGRALVSEGGVFLHLGRPLDAELCYRRALRLLPKSSKANRIAAMSELARISADQGRFDKARVWARLTHQECTNDDIETEWLQALGVFSFRAGYLDEAVRTFSDCRDYFLRKESFLESAVSTLWLCRCLFAQKQEGEATKVAIESSFLIGHLKSNRAAAAVILELVGNAVAGRKMSLEHVSKLCDDIERMGARRGRTPVQFSRLDQRRP